MNTVAYIIILLFILVLPIIKTGVDNKMLF